MVERLRDDLDGLEVAATAVAEATGIPAAQVTAVIVGVDRVASGRERLRDGA